MTTIMSFMRVWLAHRRLPVILALLAAVLAAPSLWGGWVADDHFHRLRLVGSDRIPQLEVSPLDLFTFAGWDAGQNARMVDDGFWPWWSDPDLRAAFFRPVTVITHWLDYRLWPELPSLMHAHSVLWFAALIGVTTVLYRRLMGVTWLAGLAALLYAIDDARGMPVGFLANRNALIAAFFGVLTIITHDRWRRRGWRAGVLIAPLLLATSLLSAEAGIGTIAYLFAHVVLLDRGTWRRRVAVLALYGAVVVGWRVIWTAAGYGVWGLGPYVDPVAEPLRYLGVLPERATTLLLGQLLFPPAEAYIFAEDLGVGPFYWLAAFFVLIVVLALMIRKLEWNSMTRFWALGAVLSLLPICATFPADRMLFFVGLGGFALVAQFLCVVFGWDGQVDEGETGRATGFAVKTLAVLMVIVHVAYAPVALAVRSAIPIGPPGLLDRLQVDVPMGPEVERQSVVIVTAPIPFAAVYLPIRRALNDLPVPASTRILAPAYPAPVVVQRPDRETLLIRPGDGYLAMAADRLARGLHRPMAIGERVELTGMTATVTALTDDGRPAEVSFQFDVPLEDSSLRWLYWDGDDFASFTPPEVGRTLNVP